MVHSIHLDLHDCHPDFIGNDREKSDQNIRKYHQDLNLLVRKENSEILTFLFGGTPEVYGYSSIGLGNSFVADGHYANETNRVFLDVLVDDEQIPTEIATLAKIAFRPRDRSRKSLFHSLLRTNSSEKNPEIPEARYQDERAWGLSTHIDLVAARNLDPDKLARLIHDRIPPLISANPYETPKIHHFENGVSFAQLIDTSAVYGIVKGDKVFLDVFSCKWYSGKALNSYVASFFEAKDYTTRALLRK